MFRNVEARFVLRATVAAVLAGLSAAAAIWIDNPVVQIASAVAGSFALYLGIGAASPQVEPNIGNKLEG